MKEDKTEQHWDKLLHIRTSGRDDSHSDQYRYPYEPTPYTVLQRLADSGYIRKHNLLLDYGCGKGRVDFFLSWQTRCQSVGIEYDERIYENAQKNKETAVSSGRASTILQSCSRSSSPSFSGSLISPKPSFGIFVTSTLIVKTLLSFLFTFMITFKYT